MAAREHPRQVELRGALEALEQEWRRLRAPIVDCLRPGLTAEELDLVEEQLGMALSPELRGLWAWHDGAELPTRTVGPGGFEFLPTERVVREYRLNRQIHPLGQYGDAPDVYWHSSWVPFMTQGAQRLYIDVDRVTSSGSSPVRMVTWEWEEFDVDLAASLRDLMSIWKFLLAEGYFSWNDARQDWDSRFEDVPAPMRRWA